MNRTLYIDIFYGFISATPSSTHRQHQHYLKAQHYQRHHLPKHQHPFMYNICMYVCIMTVCLKIAATSTLNFYSFVTYSVGTKRTPKIIKIMNSPWCLDGAGHQVTFAAASTTVAAFKAFIDSLAKTNQRNKHQKLYRLYNLKARVFFFFFIKTHVRRIK